MCAVRAFSFTLMITPESFFIGFLEASCIHSFSLTQIRSVELAGVREEIYCLQKLRRLDSILFPHGQIINILCPHDDGPCMHPPRPVLSVNKPFTTTHAYIQCSFLEVVLKCCVSTMAQTPFGAVSVMPRSWV